MNSRYSGSKSLLQAKIVQRFNDSRICLKDHDYCFHSYLAATLPPAATAPPTEDLTEMDKISRQVAIGASAHLPFDSPKKKRKKDGKKKKKKKKRKRKQQSESSSSRYAFVVKKVTVYSWLFHFFLSVANLIPTSM